MDKTGWQTTLHSFINIDMYIFFVQTRCFPQDQMKNEKVKQEEMQLYQWISILQPQSPSKLWHLGDINVDTKGIYHITTTRERVMYSQIRIRLTWTLGPI